MLSYQHGYHAGNFADVVKHFVLSRLIHSLQQKDKPLFFLETHAGRGHYDLRDQQANKTGEYREGIGEVWKHRKKAPAVMDDYLKCVQKLNTEALRYYPGSPLLIIDHLRSQDRLTACELHPREFEQLESLNRQGKRVHLSHSDGVHSLTALLPPPERRGLIFIDPSFEIKTDYKNIPEKIGQAYKKFETGVFCLWYPIIDGRLHEKLLRNLSAIPARQTLRVEFNLSIPLSEGMTGCGLWIINPPYLLDDQIKTGMDYLCSIVNPGKSFYQIVKTGY
ncbi:protein involved in catabolism of external DNA [Legionella birminghamensis]|uniref:Ribosomal RNA large subunit methyltransferase J n=1 Tax=Legionella birminghamensis TaxID=28083 RepID=A0A378I968_9GAMM|nr:23S rRNA (adenine(2030)-N(6))-methyltransferase RlmJ [Legionella birminghamensis]KTC67909.1 protein involved in catabolism of external DNA [Legionella birminghamensis]STX31382.1 protein involved in catabolism of external DNA [Legionella birminghamensis]